MRSLLRAAVTAAALLAAVHPATASPYARAGVEVSRGFDVRDGSGFERVEVTFEHVLGSASGGTVSGGVGGERWNACVYAWTRTQYFWGCETPSGVTFDVQPGTATGRLRFTITDSWSRGTAVADLTLTDTGAMPRAGYEVYPGETSVRPAVLTTRTTLVRGTVRVTTRRSRTETRTFALDGPPVPFTERVSGSVVASAV